MSGAVLWFDPMKLAWNNRAAPSTLPLSTICPFSMSLNIFPPSRFLCGFFFFVSSHSLVPFLFLCQFSVFVNFLFILSLSHLPCSLLPCLSIPPLPKLTPLLGKLFLLKVIGAKAPLRSSKECRRALPSLHIRQSQSRLFSWNKPPNVVGAGACFFPPKQPL